MYLATQLDFTVKQNYPFKRELKQHEYLIISRVYGIAATEPISFIISDIATLVPYKMFEYDGNGKQFMRLGTSREDKQFGYYLDDHNRIWRIAFSILSPNRTVSQVNDNQ